MRWLKTLDRRLLRDRMVYNLKRRPFAHIACDVALLKKRLIKHWPSALVCRRVLPPNKGSLDGALPPEASFETGSKVKTKLCS